MIENIIGYEGIGSSVISFSLKTQKYHYRLEFKCGALDKTISNDFLIAYFEMVECWPFEFSIEANDCVQKIDCIAQSTGQKMCVIQVDWPVSAWKISWYTIIFGFCYQNMPIMGTHYNRVVKISRMLDKSTDGWFCSKFAFRLNWKPSFWEYQVGSHDLSIIWHIYWWNSKTFLKFH